MTANLHEFQKDYAHRNDPPPEPEDTVASWTVTLPVGRETQARLGLALQDVVKRAGWSPGRGAVTPAAQFLHQLAEAAWSGGEYRLDVTGLSRSERQVVERQLHGGSVRASQLQDGPSRELSALHDAWREFIADHPGRRVL
jgi:hypothetical protein